MSTTTEPTRDAGQLKDKVRSLRIPPAPPPAKSSKLPWLMCLLFAGGAGYLAWQVQLLKQAQVETGVAAVAAPTAGQPVATPAVGNGPESPPATATGVADSGGVVHESKGYLLPRHQILISPKVGGMVKSLRVRPPGSDDAAGQQLIE
ncbi:MAG: hypothetical protein ACKO3P_17565, partial [Planctomycetaceae bacterium]